MKLNDDFIVSKQLDPDLFLISNWYTLKSYERIFYSNSFRYSIYIFDKVLS